MVTVPTLFFALAGFLLFFLLVARAMVATCPLDREAPRFSGWLGKVLVLWYKQNRFFAVLVLLFGIKLYWIHHYATNVPFWDQWEAEGWVLYRPFLEGNLNWATLMLPHNEHRILWTRIWALGQFLLNGQWDIKWQVVVNAFFHSTVGAVFAEIILRSFRNRAQIFWIALVVVVFAGPFNCGNLLFGFQSQFYFLQFFGAGALVLIFGSRPGGLPWFLGWVCLVFAYFSMAGGVLVAGVVLTGSILRLLLVGRDRRWIRDLSWIFAAGLIFMAGIWSTPEVTHHEAIKATGIFHWAGNFIHLSAWPFASPKFSLDQALGFAVLLWSPWFLCVFLGFFNESFRSRLGYGYWLILTFGGWTLATALACAYSRGNSRAFGYSDRYADLFGMGVLLAFIAISVLLFSSFRGILKRVLVVLSISSALTWALGLYFLTLHSIEVSLPFYGGNGGNYIQNVDAYVQSGDKEFLHKEPEKEVPFNRPLLMEKFLSDPTYRSILPWTLREPIPLLEKSVPGLPGFLPGGIPPETAERVGETVWGSFHPEAGVSYEGESEFQLSRESRFPFLVLFLAGYPRAEEIQIAAHPRGKETQVLWRTKPEDEWLERRFSWAGRLDKLTARDHSGESWVALSEPRELSWLSYTSLLVAKRHDLLISLGLVLLFLVYATYPACYRASPLQVWRRFQHAWAAFRSAWAGWEGKSDRS